MPKVSDEELKQLRQSLLEDSDLNANYTILTLGSAFIATLGLLMNSPAVIIGAMIVAPLMLPMRGLALGALEGDVELFRRSLISLVTGTLLGIGLSWLVGRIMGLPESEFGSEILSRTRPNLADLAIAVAAGSISGFAKIRPQINDALAGTAIAVALMPPLCVVGITLSQFDLAGSGSAFLLFFTNFLGITLACMLVFVWGGYYVESSNVSRAIGWTLALTAAIVVPLALSLWQLLRQTQLTATLKDVLLSQTITVGQQVELSRTEIFWNREPPQVYLSVRAREPITPRQVSLLEQFILRKMRQEFQLIFLVEEVREVRSKEEPLLQVSPDSEPAEDLDVEMEQETEADDTQESTNSPAKGQPASPDAEEVEGEADVAEPAAEGSDKQPAAEQPAEAQPGEVPASGEQPAEEQSSEPQSSGEQPAKQPSSQKQPPAEQPQETPPAKESSTGE